MCDRNIGDSTTNDLACNECPGPSDLSSQKLKNHHDENWLKKIDTVEPFKLDEKTRVCYMQCLNGYFS